MADSPDLSGYSDEELEQMLANMQKGQQTTTASQNLSTQPVSTVGDIAKSAETGLERGGLMLAGAPGEMADLAAKGIQYVGNTYGSPSITQAGANLQHGIEHPLQSMGASFDVPTTSEGLLNEYGPNYTPSTNWGKYTQSATEMVPAALAAAATEGGSALEALPGALTKGVTSGLGSQGAGDLANYAGMPEYSQLAQVVGALGGWGAPGLIRKGVTPFPTSGVRNADVSTLRGAGVPVSAAQATGSPLLSRLEGGTSMPQGPMTNAMLGTAGITPNPNVRVEDLINRNSLALSQEGQRLASNTNMTVDPQLVNDLQAAMQDYRRSTTSGPGGNYNKIVPQQLQQIVGMVNNSQIPGTAWWALRGRLSSFPSGDPFASHAMGQIKSALDSAMERSNPQVWTDWNNRWAANEALGKEAMSRGTAGGQLSPGAVAQNIWRKQAPLYNLARAGENVVETPVKPSEPGALSHIVGAGIGAGVGHLFGPNAMEGSIPGYLIGPEVAKMAGKALSGSVIKNPWMQKYLGNQMWAPGQFTSMSPAQAAIALSGGAVPKAAVEPPQ